MTDVTTAGERALIIVDVQNDFCEGGSMGVDGGAGVAASVTELVVNTRTSYGVVVATRDWHRDPGAHWAAADAEPNFVDTWPRHCEADTHGAAFHAELDVAFDEVFSKGAYAACYSGFEGSADAGAEAESGAALEAWLRARDIAHVDVVGIATDYCVKATALDAVAAGFTTRVLLDHCAGVAPETTVAAIDEMRSVGIELVESSR